MARHMFFGGNTPEGFYGGFGDVLFLNEARKIIYLKGSSGSGKSTLMRKVAEAFEAQGAEVDYIHCSNSITDLDGICIRELKISMVDATAPHTCDPVIPVAIDEIFNLADFINRDQVQPHAEELRKLQEQKKPYYKKAYSYLNAAYRIYENNIYIYQQAVDQVQLETAIEAETKPMYEQGVAGKPGINRNLFASAISPQGMVNYLDSLLEGYEVIALKGENGMGMDRMLRALRDMANSRGYATESCLCTLNKEKLDHLLIPERKQAYLTLNEYHTTGQQIDRIIEFGEFLDQSQIEKHIEELEYNNKLFRELLTKSMNMMDAQKEIHDRIEEIYVAGMDFAGLDGAFDTIMQIFADSGIR